MSFELTNDGDSFIRKKVIELTDAELEYLTNLVDADLSGDLYGEYESDCEYRQVESIRYKLRARLYDQTERSVIEWHDWGSIPDDGEEVLVKYANGYIDLDTAVYDEQWWRFDNGDASKAVAWAHLPE